MIGVETRLHDRNKNAIYCDPGIGILRIDGTKPVLVFKFIGHENSRITDIAGGVTGATAEIILTITADIRTDNAKQRARRINHHRAHIETAKEACRRPENFSDDHSLLAEIRINTDGLQISKENCVDETVPRQKMTRLVGLRRDFGGRQRLDLQRLNE